MAKRHSEENIEIGLRTLAQYNGSAHNASITLKKAGNPIAARTLSNWQVTHASRYAQIREQELPKIRAVAGEKHMKLAARAVEVAEAALEQLAEQLPELRGREVSDALLKISTVSGIHTDKAQALSGAPTSIVEHRTLKDLMRGLERAGVIEGDAEEIVTPGLESGNGKNVHEKPPTKVSK